jgi:uncharacterized protein YndB with AHSA1/START domain
VVVKAPTDVAFHVFTEEIASWWPIATHSVSDERAKTVVMECRPGGRLYEVDDAGNQHDWGVVTAWEPPARVAFTWHPGRGPDTHQDVEVRFTPEGADTRVELVHTGWEKLGDEAEATVHAYTQGWEPVLARYVEAAGRAA